MEIFKVKLLSVMAGSSRQLTDDMIERLLELDSDDEEFIGGMESDDEPDEIIEEFRDEEFSSEDEETLANLQARTSNFLKVLSVPRRMYGSKKYKWSGEVPKKSGRTPRRNIVLHPAGNKGPAKKVSTILEAWSLFFDDENLGRICLYTNAEINVQRQKYKSDRENYDPDESPTSVRPSYTRDTTIIEIKALIGLYYLSGVLKMNSVTVRELFDKDTGVPYFRATMSGSRFEFLTNCLRFDDKNTREERRKVDRLAPIRELFDDVVNKSAEFYNSTDCCTIDEQLLAFKGRCPFRMYIPNKPDKYGIKIVLLCDSKTFYMMNAEVYLGKKSTPRSQPVADYYLQSLTSPIHGTNRNITCDNWFTSIPSATTLLEKNITLIGTLRQNKKEIHLEMKDKYSFEKNSAKFAFSGALTLLGYCPPKGSTKKVANLLSTMHIHPDEDKTVSLPEMIVFYNKTKGGVDTFDQLCHTYSVSRKTRRWPLCLFFGLLNTVGINSMILLKQSEALKKEKISNRRTFLKTLSLQLITPYMEQRRNWPTLSSNIREMINGILKTPHKPDRPEGTAKKQGRCRFCPTSKDRKSKTFCNKCQTPICGEHQIKMCPNCV